MLTLKMKMYDQIGTSYRACRLYYVAISSYKKGLNLSYQLNHQEYELIFYERLALCYSLIEDFQRMTQYQKRAFNCIFEPSDGFNRINAQNFIDAKCRKHKLDA